MARLVPAVLLATLAMLRAAVAADISLPPGAPLTPEVVAALVRADLAQRGVAGELAIDVRQPAAALPNQAATALRVTLEDLRYDRRTGRFQGRLAAVLASGETKGVATFGRVDELVEVAVPSRPIARGETIAAGDIVTAVLPLASLPEDCLRRPAELVGQQAVRPLPVGRPARAGEVAAPWQVRRGEAAGMSFSRGGLQIVTAAEVLENGRQGQTIRVRNAASGEVRQAVVIGPRRVEVVGMLP